MAHLRQILVAAAALGLTALLLIGPPATDFVWQTDSHSAFRPGKGGGTEIGTRSTHTQEDSWGMLGYFTVRRQMCEDIFADGNHVVVPWTTTKHFDIASAGVTALMVLLLWLCAGVAMREGSRRVARPAT